MGSERTFNSIMPELSLEDIAVIDWLLIVGQDLGVPYMAKKCAELSERLVHNEQLERMDDMIYEKVKSMITCNPEGGTEEV